MAFAKVAAPLGAKVQYEVSPEVKCYTLRDVGFMETKQGNFQWKRSLDPTPQMKTGFTLKITIDRSMTKLKMSIVDKTGLNQVNIFDLNHQQQAMIEEKFEFYMQTLLQRHCLSVIE